MNNMTINFELPANVITQAGLNPSSLSDEVKKIVLVFLYEHKRISLSKACEVSGMTQWEFFEMNKALGINLNYSKKDLNLDLEKLANV
ncbi:MAG: UPF0175 family protein [Ignavibacteriota bacterium]